MPPPMLPAAFVAPQPAYWAPEAVFMANVQEMILNQVHYYVSTEDLLRDEFLRQHMHPEEGWISVQNAIRPCSGWRGWPRIHRSRTLASRRSS